MPSVRTFAVFGLGAIVGALALGLVPFVRYDYGRIGNDFQRVDRLTGRVEYAGDEGWWNRKEMEDEIEAEVARFSTRSEEIVRAAREGRLASVAYTGRQFTVYPKEGTSYHAYATDAEDPRIGELLEKLRAYGVRIA